jgi:hypothetical protein
VKKHQKQGVKKTVTKYGKGHSEGRSIYDPPSCSKVPNKKSKKSITEYIDFLSLYIAIRDMMF